MNIHPAAVIESGAEIHKSAYIGPYCVIGAHAKIGEGTRLESHVVVAGETVIGKNNKIFPFVSLGHAPQDLKFKGEKSQLVIGDNNVIREHVTMNPGTEGGGMETTVGNNCLFMVASHVAHDCKIGNHVILANNATLAGHVEIGDYAVIGGLAAIHQFVRVGTHAMIGGMSGIENDVVPYGNAYGERAGLMGLNLIGLKRRGFDKDAINIVRKAFRELFNSSGNFAERVEKIADTYKDHAEVQEIIDFIKSKSQRGLLHPKGIMQE